MEDINNLIEELKQTIITKFQELKTELFMSNGTIFNRDWPDLTEKYKPVKQARIGQIYPMNILDGTMLNELIYNALIIESDYDGNKLTLHLDVDTERMEVPYAQRRNFDREYISFSPEEKQELIDICQNTIKEHFGSL